MRVRFVAWLASFFVGAASSLSPVLAQQQPPIDGSLAPLGPYVTTETIAQLAGFATRDRLCLEKVAGNYSLSEDYKSCVDGIRGTTYCDAEAGDIADLQALIDSDPRLSALVVRGVNSVADYASAHCAKRWPTPSRELLAASSRALVGQCHTIMPVLIAQAITLTQTDHESPQDPGLCRSSLGRSFIEENCNQLVRYKSRAGSPSRRPPYELGIESYFCPEEYVKLL